MDPVEIIGLAPIMLAATWLTERIGEWVPEGRVRKLLVPLPVLIVLAVATLAELALTGAVTWDGFGRAFVAGLLTIAGHNVRVAGESGGDE